MVPSLTSNASCNWTRYQGTSRDVSVYQFRHGASVIREHLPQLPLLPLPPAGTAHDGDNKWAGQESNLLSRAAPYSGPSRRPVRVPGSRLPAGR